MEQNSKLLKGANIVFFIITVIINILAGRTTLIGGVITGEISDANPSLITPAGFTFAIWLIIYILLGFFVGFQALPRNRDKIWTEKVGWYFVLSSVFNIVWLFLWQFEYLVFSTVVMFLLLFSLMVIYTRLEIGRSKVDIREKFLIHVPISVYFGWITIASIANVTTTLVSLNWDGFGLSQEIWALLIIIIALLLTIVVVVKRKDVAYGLVVVWALLGIWIGQSNPNVVTMTQISLLIILIGVAITILRDKLR